MAVGRGDQHPHIAVAQDEAHLLGLEQGVERHKDPARRRRAKAGHHGLEAFFQVDGHSLATPQAQGQQTIGHATDRLVQFPIAPGLDAIGQRRAIGRPRGGHGHEFVQQG